MTTHVSRYQKGKTNLDFTEARDSEWQWHPLGHMQVCTSLQTDNHASTPLLSFLHAGCPSCRPTNSVKALKALNCNLHCDALLCTSSHILREIQRVAAQVWQRDVYLTWPTRDRTRWDESVDQSAVIRCVCGTVGRAAERCVLQVAAWRWVDSTAWRPASHLSRLCTLVHAAHGRPAAEETHRSRQVTCALLCCWSLTVLML